MNIQLPNWLTGLGQSGWIAVILLLAFAIIATLTVVMIWKVTRQTRRLTPKNDIEPTAPPPARAVARKAAPKKAPPADSDPVAEAEVYLTYGLFKQAINVLEKHLAENPGDNKAKKMLEQARKKT